MDKSTVQIVNYQIFEWSVNLLKLGVNKLILNFWETRLKYFTFPLEFKTNCGNSIESEPSFVRTRMHRCLQNDAKISMIQCTNKDDEHYLNANILMHFLKKLMERSQWAISFKVVHELK